MISLATGGWFVAYFHDAPSLFVGFFTLQAPMSAYVFAGLLTATTYVFAGTLREQVCTYMCPWPRIQAAMLDQEALSVTYRYDRGDPRGAHKKNDSWEGRGDCIDCRQCVAACPAGIDIRDGLQIECINCALCIDACDEIMVKVDRPKGLIAYDTIQNIERRQAGEKPGYRFIRGRTLFYAVLFVGIGGLMIASLLMRSTLDVNVQRDRAPLFVPLSTGQVRNAYTVKVLNKANHTRDVRIQINGVRGGHLQANELPVVDNSVVLTAGPDRVAEVRLFVVADPERLQHRSTPVMIEVQSAKDGEIAKSKSVFIRGDHSEERDDDD
jgi:cytochrome c oxidase accessory protein FixG